MTEVKVLGTACAVTWLTWSVACTHDAGDDRHLRELATPVWQDCASVPTKTPYDVFFQHGDASRRLALAGEVSDVLEHLSRFRQVYLASGKPVEVFPAMYFETTLAVFDLALRSGSPGAPVHLEMVIRFHDAHAFNRQAFERGDEDGVEPHWRPYFRRASAPRPPNADRPDFEETTRVLMNGIDAHVVYDEPRLLRYMRDQERVPPAVLTEEFARVDEVFAEASIRTLGAIRTALKISPDSRHERTFLAGAARVREQRKKALALALSDEALPTTRPQPVLAHNVNSRTFFPADLMARGLCR